MNLLHPLVFSYVYVYGIFPSLRNVYVYGISETIQKYSELAYSVFSETYSEVFRIPANYKRGQVWAFPGGF